MIPSPNTGEAAPSGLCLRSAPCFRTPHAIAPTEIRDLHLNLVILTAGKDLLHCKPKKTKMIQSYPYGRFPHFLETKFY